MAKKVYLVTFDSHDDSWGCEICCGGIFRSKKRAEKVANCLPLGKVHEVQRNTETGIYLGGYCE